MAFLTLPYIFAPFGRIEAVRNRMITLNDEEIPIGTSYEKSFFERFV